jgi:predicted RNA-binding protein with RPS1 domain
VVEGEVKNITEFGLFIGLDGDIDGMVHLSDLDWNRSGEEAMADYKKGDVVKAQVLDVDVEKERISLGVKQLDGDPFAEADRRPAQERRGHRRHRHRHRGWRHRGGVDGQKAFIRRSDLARDRQDQRPERFSVGDRWMPRHQYRPALAPHLASPSRRCRSPRRKRRWRSTAPPTAARRWATSSARRSRALHRHWCRAASGGLRRIVTAWVSPVSERACDGPPRASDPGQTHMQLAVEPGPRSEDVPRTLPDQLRSGLLMQGDGAFGLSATPVWTPVVPRTDGTRHALQDR